MRLSLVQALPPQTTANHDCQKAMSYLILNKQRQKVTQVLPPKVEKEVHIVVVVLSANIAQRRECVKIVDGAEL